MREKQIKTFRKWSNKEILELTKLRTSHTTTEIMNIFQEKGYNRSKKAIERKAHKLGIYFECKKTFSPELDNACNDNRFSATWETIKDIKKQYQDGYNYCKIGLIPKNKIKRKILCISDFHIPFERDDLIHEIINEHQDADILVVNGDLLDLHAVSTWPKERAIILKNEYDIAMEYLKLFSERFPHVVLTRGNHEYRLNRYFHTNIVQDVSFLINKEILGRLANGEVYDQDGNIIEIHKFKNVHYARGQEAWFIKIGKTIFTHPQAFSKVEAKTAINAQKHFIEKEDIDCIVVAHTHKQAFVPTQKILCIEQGCLCCPMDYEKQGKLSYNAMTLGYTVVYQDADGNCDFNKTHNVYLGIQHPIKLSFDETLNKLRRR